jgi:hypothetical protein
MISAGCLLSTGVTEEIRQTCKTLATLCWRRNYIPHPGIGSILGGLLTTSTTHTVPCRSSRHRSQSKPLAGESDRSNYRPTHVACQPCNV